MPKQIRKRGKKFKSRQEKEPPLAPVMADAAEEGSVEYPFGELPSELKAYFRSVDIQLRDWEGENEDKQLLYVAALKELRGHERMLATDPECSIILERMIPGMDDFVRRVFADSMCGSFEQLAKNRFSSHVLQALFETSTSTVSRESLGRYPHIPHDSVQGELRSLTQLVLDISDEVSVSLSPLISDRYAAHVLVALCCLLSGKTSDEEKTRSKKSQKYKSRQGLSVTKGKDAQYNPPDSFVTQANQILSQLIDSMSANEIRSLSSFPFSCALLTLLLDIEFDQRRSNRKLYNILSFLDEGAGDHRDAYLFTISKDPVASHVAQMLFTFAPDHNYFDSLWETLFSTKQSASFNRGSPMWRAILHPITNHVLSHALQSARMFHLRCVFDECDNLWRRVVMEEGRWGLLTSLGDRIGVLSDNPDSAQELDELKERLVKAYLSTFDFPEDQDQCRQWFAGTVLKMQAFSGVQHSPTLAPPKETADAPTTKKSKRHTRFPAATDMQANESAQPETTVQGSILLQSLLRIPGSPSKLVVDSMSAMPSDRFYSWIVCDEKGSRLLDALFCTPSRPSKPNPHARVVFRLLLQVGFHRIVNDKYGSFLAEKIWRWGDNYVKSKVRAALVPHTGNLSNFGKIFVTNCRVDLRRHGDDGWSNKPTMQHTADPEKNDLADTFGEPSSKKRSRASHDAIDEAFDALPPNHTKRAKISSAGSNEADHRLSSKGKRSGKTEMMDRNLQRVLDAIK